jgi:hypothetical protein
MNFDDLTEFIFDTDTPLTGFELAEPEAAGFVAEHFPGRPFCLVKDWILVDLKVSDAAVAALAQRSLQPIIVYALHVIHDSRGRFSPGDWVKSSYQASFSHNCLFESKNTIYVLMGSGSRKFASIDTVLALQ